MVEEHYTEIEMSDVIDNSEQLEQFDFPDSENQNASLLFDTEIIQNTEETLEEPVSEEKKVNNQSSKPEIQRPTRLPTARIKNIMKMDPDVSVVSADAVFLVTKATELFLETLGKETYSYVASTKRKTIAKKDLDVVFNKVDCLCFLEGAMDF